MCPDAFGAATKEGLSSLTVFAIKISDFYLYKGFLHPTITLFLDTEYLLHTCFGLRPKKSLLAVCILLLSTPSYTWNIAVAFQGPDQEWVFVMLNTVQTEIMRSICFGEIKSALRQDLYPPGEMCSCWSSGWPWRGKARIGGATEIYLMAISTPGDLGGDKQPKFCIVCHHLVPG